MLFINKLTQPGRIDKVVLRQNRVEVKTRDGKTHLYLRNESTLKKEENNGDLLHRQG